MSFFRPPTFMLPILFGWIHTVLLVGAQQSSSTTTSSCPSTWQCMPLKNEDVPPVLDGKHDDWKDVEAYNTTLIKALTGEVYLGGEDNNAASYKCLYDSQNVYFALEIPGDYSFSTHDDHLCAAIATMFKIGKKATFVNMGGCPDALSGCDDGVPDTCDDYRVDIGAHWELKGTKQNTLYGVAASSSPVTTSNRQVEPSSPTFGGDDPIANKDDEYGVSSYCRFDDKDAPYANNEWSGAWSYQDANSINNNEDDGGEEELGRYHFELSRKLQTASLVTDAQLAVGDTIQFGIAFWDPYEMPAGGGSSGGWTPAGHYVTGCGTNWIELELVGPIVGTNNEEEPGHNEAASVLPPSNTNGGDFGAVPDEPNNNRMSSSSSSVWPSNTIRVWSSLSCFMVALVLACASACY